MIVHRKYRREVNMQYVVPAIICLAAALLSPVVMLLRNRKTVTHADDIRHMPVALVSFGFLTAGWILVLLALLADN